MATIRLDESRTKKEDKFIASKTNFRAGSNYNNKKSNSGYDKRSDYREGYGDVDEDYSKRGIRTPKQKEQTKTKLPPDRPPAKYEAMKRMQMEKKAMQKKLADDEYDKQKYSAKQKKTSKTNWIKHYENGILDEDDI